MENHDEMEDHIKDKSFFVSTITLVIVAELFVYVRMINGHVIWDLCITEWAAITAGFLYRFIRTRNKLQLLIVVASGLMLAISIFCMIKHVVIF